MTGRTSCDGIDFTAILAAGSGAAADPALLGDRSGDRFRLPVRHDRAEVLRRSVPVGVLCMDTPAGLVEIDDETGSHTVAGVGEYCCVCGDPLEPGAVFVYVRLDGAAGIAHETLSCVEASDILDERWGQVGGGQRS